MKNIKIVSAMLLTAAAFASARADYFVYWQVSSSPYYTDPSAVIAYTYATIRAAEDQNYLQLYSPDAAASLETEKLAAGGEAYAGMLDKNYRGNLLVELWDANGKVAWQTYGLAQYESALWKNGDVGSGTTPLTVSVPLSMRKYSSQDIPSFTAPSTLTVQFFICMYSALLMP